MYFILCFINRYFRSTDNRRHLVYFISQRQIIFMFRFDGFSIDWIFFLFNLICDQKLSYRLLAHQNRDVNRRGVEQ